MTWKCPRCGNSNNDSIKKCSCGYAFYEVLAVDPDASPEKVEQAYKHLIKFWGSHGSPNETASLKRAEERLKNINDAYTLFRQFTPSAAAIPERKNITKIATIAAIVVLFSVALLVFILKKEDVKEPSAQKLQKEEAESLPSKEIETKNITPGPTTIPAGESKAEGQRPVTGNTVSPPATSAEKSEEWAIESVRKTYFPRALSNVETVINKWTNDNTGKYKVIGWQAKKMDEQTYLVSYTVSDGLATKGFYFDISTETGTVRPLEEHPELQKKYGIEFNKQ